MKELNISDGESTSNSYGRFYITYSFSRDSITWYVPSRLNLVVLTDPLAFLPHKFVDHSHADAILAIVDQPNAEKICREVFCVFFILI